MWYVQGSLMLIMWIIAISIFKCGRMRSSRREEQLAKDREVRLEEARNTMVEVTRDGQAQSILASQLTVGDKFRV